MIILRKALVALGVLAMVTAAVPASASTQLSETKEITANGTVQFGQQVTHNIAGWSSSSTDTLYLGSPGYHTIRVDVNEIYHGSMGSNTVKVHIDGEEAGYLKPGSNYFPVKTDTSYAIFKYYGKSTGTKSFKVTYYR
ncbi:hypothetical protein ABE144_12265 [Brevibacillus laterosporus]|uniref:hypothetical protein n=1 Tax=Brevibacillus laterosporus TaxID=1465 RepID=UPI003D232BAD